MPEIVFDPYLFLRTPALSYKDYDITLLEELLKQQFFQAAVFFASESLYMELERCNFVYQALDKKVKLSLQKYFNRMCHRPTPFGMFSAFSSLEWGTVDKPTPVSLAQDGEVFVNPDFQFTAEIARRMKGSQGFAGLKYYANNTIYSIKGEKRYLTDRFDTKKKKTDFFINSFETNRLLNKLLLFCKNGKSKPELALWLGEFVDDAEDVKSYIDDLIGEGLLVTELLPNMTGEKYFDRLVKIACKHAEDNQLANEIRSYADMIENFRQGGGFDIKKITGSTLYTQHKGKFKSMFYVSYERKSLALVNRKYQEDIKDGLRCLSKITSEAHPRSLTNFAAKFRAKFEDQEIPLLLALDREAGIGYEGLETNLVSSELLDGVQLDMQSNALSFSWTPVHELFLSKLVEKGVESISISDEDLERFKEQPGKKTPPGFSVIFRIFGDQIWIEQAGGCTATALLGRFSLFSDKVFEETRRMVAVEEKANPDVIFAEISCFNDEHAANINANAGIRIYEIPIGAHSTVGNNNIINLSDLVISVAGSNITLRSKKLNKVVIPRLSSAFNFSRSELAIFRFLCDLQYQGLKFNFNFDLRTLLPGLNYYPRVEYKKCILFPATWILDAPEIATITGAKITNEVFLNICERNRLAKCFALTEGDNQLLFDRDDAISMELFKQVIKSKTQVVLQEVFINEKTDIKDQGDKPYTGQFIASVFAGEVTYPQKNVPRVVAGKSNIKRIYLPGDEWVYFKLYCHPATSNALLVKDVAALVAGLKKQGALKNWFFIRYADPEPHLRVRIKINPSDAAKVVKRFETKLSPLVKSGRINNLVVDTYKREIERYGHETIEHAEKIFGVSSDLITGYLKNFERKQTAFSEPHLAIVSVDALLTVFFRDNYDRINLTKLMHEGMKHEFDDSRQVKVQLDNKFREYSGFFNNIDKNKPEIVSIAGKKEFDRYVRSLALLRSGMKGDVQDRLIKLAADLIHMHLNRLFSDKQRSHEFIIYYLLHKYYQSVEARKVKRLSSFSPAFKGPGVNHIDDAVFKKVADG